MQFKIKNILLWPKNKENDLVNIEFDLDNVNVITGGSSRGKSAIISIIDYCLGSGICRIPTSVIRDKTSWFGIIVQLSNSNNLLLARKEPGDLAVSNDMYMKESSLIEIPNTIESNFNVRIVKSRLDNIAGLTHFNFKEDEDDEGGFKSRPSFRDLVTLNFQPQHIIANQSTLFYKTDLFQHREKLRTIFPYILGAVDDDYLKNQEELKDLQREVGALNKDLDKRKKLVGRWIAELKSNYTRAIEFGLLDTPFPEDDWSSEVYINYLKSIEETIDDKIPIITEGISNRVSNRVSELEKIELEQSHNLYNLKNRYELIKKLEQSSKEYREHLLDQYGRLKTVSWFNKHLEESNKCPLCGNSDEAAKRSIERLVEANDEILRKGATINDNYTTLSNETEQLRKEIRALERAINLTRRELDNLKTTDVVVENRLQNIFSINRFVGNLQAEIKNYEEFNDNSELIQKIREIERRITEIESTFNEKQANTKLERAKKLISENIKFYASIFEAEFFKEAIKFDEKNLTLSFITQDGRENALYEIGSGANYMAYHISTLLALHEFFNKQRNTPIPSFIIFDQPSQVYFPDRSDAENTNEGEDVERVKKIFNAISQGLNRIGSGFQIIVIEHVGEYAWNDFDNIKKLRRWRGDSPDSYLIPTNWN